MNLHLPTDETRRRRVVLAMKVAGLSALGVFVYRMSGQPSLADIRDLSDRVPNDGVADTVADTFRNVTA